MIRLFVVFVCLGWWGYLSDYIWERDVNHDPIIRKEDRFTRLSSSYLIQEEF